MFRIILRFKRYRILVLSALTLALIAAAFFFTQQQKPVPVVSAAINSHQSIDLGAGYRLETNAQSGQIVAPKSALRVAPQAAAGQHQTMDLGAGYKLMLNAEGGQILPPAAVVLARPVTKVQTMGPGSRVQAGVKLARRPDPSPSCRSLGPTGDQCPDDGPGSRVQAGVELARRPDRFPHLR